MKGLFLYGANCTMDVWKDLKPYLHLEDIEFVEYPHEITKNAKGVSDITRWVCSKYKNQKFDFIVGHSMGGIIALEMVSEFGFDSAKVILIETNLKPAEVFYRNLMTEDNMKKHGERVIKMIKDEMPFYGEELKKSIQEDFDYSEYIRKYTGSIYGIYGDRGVKEYPNRLSDFCLDKDVEDKIDFNFISNSCHMIMIENPKELSMVLRKICE